LGDIAWDIFEKNKQTKYKEKGKKILKIANNYTQKAFSKSSISTRIWT